MKLLLPLLLLLSSCACVPTKHYTQPLPASQVIVFEDDVTLESATNFAGQLKAAGGGNGPIFVILRTGGGSARAGFIMARAIQESANPVVCIADTMAMSMGFYILESCDRRIMTKNALLMMHSPYSAAPGAKDNPELARYFDELLKSWCEFFAVKMKPTGTELYNIIKASPDGELFLNSKTARELGAVDQVDSSLKEALRDPFKEQF
jgi:ATP-dependent protease ClpP protease subunit